MASKIHNLDDSDFDIDEDADDLEVDETWNDWNAEENADEDYQFNCLFCDFKFQSCDSLLQHCHSTHHFDFPSLKLGLGLDFYGCFKLVNYIRAMVAQNTCWSCGHRFKANQELLNHLHETKISEELKLLWDDDKFLQPFMEGDSLLYSFDQDEDFEDDECMPPVDEEELSRIVKEAEKVSLLLGDVQKLCSDDEMMVDADPSGSVALTEATKALASTSIASSSRETMVNGVDVGCDSYDIKKKDLSLKASFGRVAASEIKKVNESYFGSYSSFGIHREMLSDKVRMDSYSQAILKNPSLFGGAAVMDVGCGTGILSLFAAQAGASRVIAVDASEKMAAVATQIAKDNGFLKNESICNGSKRISGVVEVVHGMIEDIEKSVSVKPHSIDVLLSEWMGYCLLYESMLSSVLFARDRWLKPGGAILPDTATMFAAGFGRGCTSLPFWENVYGIDMSSVGKELVKDAAERPIVDVVDSHDIVTETAVLKESGKGGIGVHVTNFKYRLWSRSGSGRQPGGCWEGSILDSLNDALKNKIHDLFLENFDLATMKIEDMDFTSSIVLQPKSGSVTELCDMKHGLTWCHGVVLWFDTGFTSRFCKEMSANLSTSPFTPKTHWVQTIFTFREPIALSAAKIVLNRSAVVGTNSCPASKIEVRISIVRAPQHRAIDISLETSAVSHDCQRQAWPVQIFNLS